MRTELKLLVIDDDHQHRHDLKVVLDFMGEPVIEARSDNWQGLVESQESGSDALVAVFICNIESPLENLLKALRRWDAHLPFILCGDFGTQVQGNAVVENLIIAHINEKPSYACLTDTLHRAERYREAQTSNKRNDQSRPIHLFRSLVGTSRNIESVREMMSQVADKEVSVLILGDSGTGKEVVARNLHYSSERRNGPFVPVNCGAIPAELLESELFGHEKGAFTGAISARAGRFEMAEGGTLFLDEIGDMPLNMQVKILRVLQERVFERVGSNKTQSVNVRIIAATHRNLENMIEAGTFREDLFYRLNVFPIEMPSLNERAEDIPLLINELVARLESEKRGSVRFNSAAIMSLSRHSWPGNVRELANLVERMAILHPYGVIGVQDLPEKYRHVQVEEEAFSLPEEDIASHLPSVASMNDRALLPDEGIDLKEYLNNLERNLIQQALDDCGGVVARAATRLAIRRTTLVEKMRKYGLQRA
ncbi:sigma-54-dependent transcriptional regulator [Marinibactrum halimedae]|uniref:Sigma-54-dependent Fis family transcriptional regulator n=1 Tax=Marinibactrum halimedae TaxID=1444977 RepID=A0AA37WMR3_9GAMM|nr:sigma-54 dependent transcriptional regulator [Marinibactrum halimedae]MCD9460872.1 sigma-54 dependent transcriptional regulator [Marinibactrum halimedae]GLS27349.1 sigma-54-dependent Fis family transcriptional regulator [Marinibactrum halimedae]